MLERMTLELFAMAEPHLLIPGTGGVLRKMSEAVTDMVAYTKLTDSILLLIDMSIDPALAPAQELLASIRCRKLYKFVGKAQPGADGDPARLSRAQLPYIRTEIAQRLPRSNGSGVSGLGVKEDDIVLDLIHISHGLVILSSLSSNITPWYQSLNDGARLLPQFDFENVCILI